MSIIDDIKDLLSNDLARVNEIIVTTLRADSPMTNAIVAEYLRTKGKQLRPMMVLLSARFHGAMNDAVYHAAAAIEMLHNASLIHDDVIDQARSRRSHPTINSVWDNHVAVLIGDFFVTGALQAAVATGHPGVLRSLAAMGRDLSVGEINQIDNARRHVLDERCYMDTISRKTASLFVSCSTVGALAAGADDTTAATLNEFARLLGLCFQIKDDIFDYYDSGIVGKPTGNDLREGKVTLPLLHALNADDEQAAQMRELVLNEMLSPEQIAVLVDFAKQRGGIRYAQDVMNRLRDEARALLKPYGDNAVTPVLLRLLDHIIDREY